MGLKSVVFDKGVEVVQDILKIGGETNNSNPNDREPSSHRQNARDQQTMERIRESQNTQPEVSYGYDSNSKDGVLEDSNDNGQSYDPTQGGKYVSSN